MRSTPSDVNVSHLVLILTTAGPLIPNEPPMDDAGPRENRELLSLAKRSDGILKALHVGEPQDRGRGIEAPKLRC